MTLATVGFDLVLTAYDSGYNVFTRAFRCAPAIDTYAEAVALVPTLEAAWNAVSDARIQRIAVVEGWEDATPLETLVTPGSHVENVALVVSELETAGKFATNRIPAPVDGIFVGLVGPAYNIVDVLDADLQTFLELFISGGGFTLSDGELLDSGVPTSGKRIHRKSRNG